jgi:hypothetical protein
VHDADVQVLDEQEDGGSGVGSADADVMQAASTTTPVMTSRAFDMAEHRTPANVSYVLRDAFPMS